MSIFKCSMTGRLRTLNSVIYTQFTSALNGHFTNNESLLLALASTLLQEVNAICFVVLTAFDLKKKKQLKGNISFQKVFL